MSRALRDQAVWRSNWFIEFGTNSVSIIGVDVSTLFGRRKLKLLSYGLLLVSVVVECVTRWLLLLFVVVGKGVRERNGNVSTNGVEPNGVGVLLRGLSVEQKKRMCMKIDCIDYYRLVSMMDIEYQFDHFPTKKRTKFDSCVQGVMRI
jgi:hypothetical protein